MTICIAALCENGKGCILTSDQMTTAHFPVGYEFENDEIEKIIPIIDSVCVLVAGDVLFAHEVIGVVKVRFKDSVSKKVEEVAEAIRATYQEMRRKRIVRSELETRGLDINTYYSTQQRLVPAIVQMIDQAFRTFDPRVEFIVCGKDTSGCHVYAVQNPGQLTCHDPIGFAAIGSGAPHAFYSLIEANYKKSMDKSTVEKLINTAKKRSEVAPGVGRATSSKSL